MRRTCCLASSDLKPLDFFFWGHMKSLVYQTPVDTVEDLAAGDIASTPEQYQSDKPLFPFFASDVLKLVNDCIQHFKILKPENERIEKHETLCKFNFSDPNLHNDKS
ncbi:hypothetical protein AVEN_96510-1 [Araneus ventricosus]|uniref:Uncharacterized protein n=1 Tax=Araneus ventricosus TaxID=182803 RepID=A0A4Y2CVN4_ARAVE|nr:hypothetical protein AVEN_96510-1 [Araneus ventricosus]